jgi:murein DD-endopeptidase MepM/ murein hydrolase activator NlpD
MRQLFSFLGILGTTLMLSTACTQTVGEQQPEEDISDATAALSDVDLIPGYRDPMRGVNITQHFGNYYVKKGGYHLGVDMKSADWKVYAAAPGRVVFQGATGGNGNVVVLEHSLAYYRKVYTSYSHLSRILVKTNDTVSADTQIGVMGDSGCAGCGAHLHFVIASQQKANPWGYMRMNPDGVDRTQSDYLNYDNMTFYNPERVSARGGYLVP